MKMSFVRKATCAAVGMAFAGTTAWAAVTFDPATGIGFVGKGDVQDAFVLNNAQLQNVAEGVRFRVNSVVTNTWECYRFNTQGKEIRQERNNEITLAGLLSVVTRDNRRQVTGFILAGYDGGQPQQTRDGPATGSCPADQGGWTLDANSLQTSGSGTQTVQVSLNGSDPWISLN